MLKIDMQFASDKNTFQTIFPQWSQQKPNEIKSLLSTAILLGMCEYIFRFGFWKKTPNSVQNEFGSV